MKQFTLVSLLACGVCTSVMADEPFHHQYQNGGYWDGMTQQAGNKKASDVDKAHAAIQAGQDPTEVLGATAAGSKAYTSHPYLNRGYYGERINGDRE
jgi:hypothetical protein